MRRRRKEEERPLQGILLLDKEVGVTSHDVVQRVRRLYRTRRVGHAGTLDPVASGVLVLLLGSATRIAQYLQADDKEYRLTLLLGRETDTQDVTGSTVAEADPSSVTLEGLERVLERYRGSYRQTPPSFSAVKQGGQPLYRLARKGVAVTAPPRDVTIYHLEVEEWAPPRCVLKVHCSKGTYMRTLCHDVGRDLGVGGCLESLVRLRSGAFALEQSHRAEELEAAGEDPDRWLLEAASGLPFDRVEPGMELMDLMLHGRGMPWEGPLPGKLVSVVHHGWLIALGEVVERRGERLLVPRKVLEPKWKRLFKRREE